MTTIHIMQDGLLGGKIKPTDLVFAKSSTLLKQSSRIFVVLDLVPPNQLRCLTCENKIRTLYVNVRDYCASTQNV